MRLAGIKESLDPSRPVILKDNISWHLPMPSANSTPWQLEGVIRELRDSGYRDLVAVENKTVVTRPKHGEKLNKFDKVFEKYRIPILFNFNREDMAWIRYEPKSPMRVLNRIFPEGIHIPDYFINKNIVHLPTVKCHIYSTTTGAMKNAFGGLLSIHRHYTHTWIHETLVDLLAIQKEIHSGLFAVMDGTTLGNGPGPRTLKPVLGNLILASADQVAIDAVAATIMGFDPMRDVAYIRMATEAGLGTGRIQEIDIVGGEIDPHRRNFRVGNNFAGRVGRLCWFGPLKWAQHLLFHTPLVLAFVTASDVYHDKIWWNLKGRRIFKTWKRESPWGRLFERY
jgi:uncharacterized protein (DUF362 family)